jgi:hypothetical protein
LAVLCAVVHEIFFLKGVLSVSWQLRLPPSNRWPLQTSVCMYLFIYLVFNQDFSKLCVFGFIGAAIEYEIYCLHSFTIDIIFERHITLYMYSENMSAALFEILKLTLLKLNNNIYKYIHTKRKQYYGS